jgi:dUTP pyrophosphatase
VKKLSALATIPTRNTQSDAGIDLTCIKKEIIPSNTIKLLSTGLAFEIPEGYYGQIAERSGFSINNTLKLKAGVIDSGYRGEVKIAFQNCGDYPITVEAGTKVAQMLLLPVPEFTVEEAQELATSERGEKGFGSSDAAAV